MNTPRQALSLSTLYAFPLMAWLFGRLYLIDANLLSVDNTLEQTLITLIFLQCATIGLVFMNRPLDELRSDILAVFQILLFPLPFYSIIWLTGSTSLIVLMKSMFTVFAIGLIALLVRQIAKVFDLSKGQVEIICNSVYLALAILIWNLNSFYFDWLKV